MMEPQRPDPRPTLFAQGLRRHVARALGDYLQQPVQAFDDLNEVLEDFGRHLIFSYEDSHAFRSGHQL